MRLEPDNPDNRVSNRVVSPVRTRTTRMPSNNSSRADTTANREDTRLEDINREDMPVVISKEDTREVTKPEDMEDNKEVTRVVSSPGLSSSSLNSSKLKLPLLRLRPRFPAVRVTSLPHRAREVGKPLASTLEVPLPHRPRACP